MSKRAIQYTAVYNRKNKTNDEGKALVQIEAYKDAARVYFGTGIYIKPANWDANKCQVQKLKNSVELNNRITELVERYKDIEFNRNRGNPDFSVWDLKQALENNHNDSFIAFARAQLCKEKNLSEGTKIKYTKAINTFAEFAKGDVTFAQLNNRLIDDFDFYLISEKLIANTRKNYFKTLTKYSRLAVRYGMLDYNKNPFLDKKITKEKTTRHSLNDVELKKLENLKFTAEQQHLELVRDLFLLQCYTGLRFSDAARLGREHIFETSEGMEIRMMSQKENKPVNLPLRYLFKDRKKMSRPERLIKKYWQQEKKPFFLSLKSQTDDKANNQYVNRQLKDIQGMAGVQTVLTNHVGRHTFATYLVNRVPLPVVQELLQHSKVETTMIYIHVGTDKVKEHLKKITDWI
jgi:site-specific recombinase XerD